MHYGLYYTGVGDTSLFVLRKDEKGIYKPKIIYPINKNEFIDQNPILLNWKKAFKFNDIEKYSLQKGDILIACTDAIARWFLENLLILQPETTRELLNPKFKIDNESLEKHKLFVNSFSNLEEMIKKTPKNKTDAIHYFYNLVENNLIEADDLTLYAELIL